MQFWAMKSGAWEVVVRAPRKRLKDGEAVLSLCSCLGCKRLESRGRWEEMSSSLHEFNNCLELKPDFVPNLFWDVSASFIGFLFMSFTGFFAFFSLFSSLFFSVLLSSLSVTSCLFPLSVLCFLLLCESKRCVLCFCADEAGESFTFGQSRRMWRRSDGSTEPFCFDRFLLSCSLFSVDWCVTCLSWTRDCWIAIGICIYRILKPPSLSHWVHRVFLCHYLRLLFRVLMLRTHFPALLLRLIIHPAIRPPLLRKLILHLLYLPSCLLWHQWEAQRQESTREKRCTIT